MRRTVWGAVPLVTGLVLAGCGSAGEGTTASAPSTAAEEVRTVEHAMGTAEVAGTGLVLDDLERFAQQLES